MIRPALIALCLLVVTDRSDAQVRVFILAGQSNMQGKGAIEHLEKLIDDDATKATYQHLREGDEWIERDDVFIRYLDQNGKLTVGYGTPKNRFGPELQFGNVMGDKFDEPVLIIKCAWGGRALAVRFRPPSSGKGDYSRRDRKTKELEPLAEEVYGEAYRDTIKIVKETLADVKNLVPDSDGKYELAGFVFFQGFNDVIDDKKVAEYGENLVNLIRDVRKDLDAPKLPFVIGELGQQGATPEKRHAKKHLGFRKAQSDVAKMPEFQGNVAYAETAIHVVPEGDSFDGGYHYYGRADTFFQIGQSFADAMLTLAKQQ
jgi:alpha-galactosidase